MSLASSEKLKGIVDIELPQVPPAPDTSLFWVTAISMLLLVFAVFWIRRRVSAKQRALRKLVRLRHSRAMQSSNTKEIAFLLAKLLRETYKVQYLNHGTVHSLGHDKDNNRWQSFLKTLDQARYASPIRSDTTIDALLEESTYWLNRAK